MILFITITYEHNRNYLILLILIARDSDAISFPFIERSTLGSTKRVELISSVESQKKLHETVFLIG